MRWGIPSADNNRGLPTLLLVGLSGGLLGFYFQIHRVFVDGSTDNIPGRTALGFIAAALLSVFLGFLIRTFTGSAVHKVIHKSFVVLSCAALFAALAYVTHVLIVNTGALFRSGGEWSDILLVYPVFVAVSLAVALILRFTVRGSFATASVLTFLLFALYILARTGSVTGVGIALLYFLYLILLGRFAAGGLARIIRLPRESGLETTLVSFTCGILLNYMVWYALGRLSLLYATTVLAVFLVVATACLLRYGRSIIRALRTNVAATRHELDHRIGPTSAVLLNVVLFCLLVLVAVLSVKFPGNTDSSARMYCATVFKFAEMHRIVFPPFYQHWPLIFQPMLLEVSGLPPYLAGGITAQRFFHGALYYSFIPFVFLLCRKFDLSYRVLVLYLLVVVSSSFSFCLAYYDKPSAMGFPAFLSFFIVCLVVMKDPRPWSIILAGALMAMIYNSKMVLMVGAIACLVFLGVHFLFNRPTGPRPGIRRAVLVALGIFLATGSLHFIQNIQLRGNPFHPMAAEVFRSSLDYPEEVRFAAIPADFYQKTMPRDVPSRLSSINLDPAKGMYEPLFKKTARGHSPRYGPLKTTISAAIIMVALLLPVILLLRPDRVVVYGVVMAAVSFFLWFGWIGDGWRYSTFFPCIALLGAVATSRPLLPFRALDHVWRYAFYGLLVCSLPMAFYFTASTPTTGHMLKFLSGRAEKHQSLDPGVHAVTTHLRQQGEIKPVLLVDDMKVTQFGFFQPNFQFKPIHWRNNLFIEMVYLSVIKPTHLLTAEPVEDSLLIEQNPALRAYLEHEIDFELPHRPLHLYRFLEATPWDRLHAQALEDEGGNPGYLADIRRFLDGYR